MLEIKGLQQKSMWQESITIVWLKREKNNLKRLSKKVRMIEYLFDRVKIAKKSCKLILDYCFFGICSHSEFFVISSFLCYFFCFFFEKKNL